MIVKVTLPDDPDQSQASIATKDGAVMFAAVELVKKRLVKDKVGFFKAEMEKGDILEIGDRVADESW